MIRIAVDDTADCWRLRCPEGHTAWRATQVSFYCEECDRSYSALIDRKTDERVGRSDVSLYSDSGRGTWRFHDESVERCPRCGSWVNDQDRDAGVACPGCSREFGRVA